MQEDILIHGLDHSLAESRSSAIVPVGYTKKGDPTAASNLATEEQYAAAEESAQAMLAQANQVPQGVLQLLQ